MKGILFTALLVFGTAASAAGIIATLANGAGGEILLTDTSCTNNSAGRIAMTTDDGGRVLLSGCAVMLPPDRLLIGWDDGQASILKSSYFTLIGTPTRGRPATGDLPSATTGGHFAKFKNR
jgi:hypothetical protein